MPGTTSPDASHVGRDGTLNRRLLAVTGAVFLAVALTGSASAGDGKSRVETRSSTGPAGVIAGPHFFTQIDGDPVGNGLGGVQSTAPAGRLRITVKDGSGRPVAARVTAFVTGKPGFVYVHCDATDFVTPSLLGPGKVYVSPLVGVCAAGSTASANSVPTKGQVTLQSVRG